MMRSIYEYIKCLNVVKAKIMTQEARNPADRIAKEARINILTVVIRDLEQAKPVSGISFWDEVS